MILMQFVMGIMTYRAIRFPPLQSITFPLCLTDYNPLQGATPTRFPGSSLTRCPRKTLRVFLALHPLQSTPHNHYKHTNRTTLPINTFNTFNQILLCTHIPTSARNKFFRIS